MTARRRRERLIIPWDGSAVQVTEDLPDASFGQRAAELRATVPDDGGPAVRIFTLRCDRCGITADLDYDRPELPPGWEEHEDGDFCPRCCGHRP